MLDYYGDILDQRRVMSVLRRAHILDASVGDEISGVSSIIYNWLGGPTPAPPCLARNELPRTSAPNVPDGAITLPP